MGEFVEFQKQAGFPEKARPSAGHWEKDKNDRQRGVERRKAGEEIIRGYGRRRDFYKGGQ